MPYFSATSSLACINQERITVFNGVPTMFIAMFNHPDYRKTDFSHMRTGTEDEGQDEGEAPVMSM